MNKYQTYYERHKPELRAKYREFGRLHPEQRMLYHSRARAKERGLEHTITIDDIVIPEMCPVLGTPIERGSPRAPNSPTLDGLIIPKGTFREML